jgi:CRP-like cAMP-binding protein
MGPGKRVNEAAMYFRNAFLSAMDGADMAALFPHLREIALFGGESLSEAGDAPQFVYFPSNSAISIVTVMKDGREVETTSIGYEGAAGLLPAVTETVAASRMCVQIGGGAITLPAHRLREQLGRSPALLGLVMRSVMGLSSQAEQAAACYALHHLTARLARWLLVCEDRTNRAHMDLTQDHLGVMAGALRSSISLIASEFKDMGLIRYSRGHMEILDRRGLEGRACECYRHDRARRDALAMAEPQPAARAALEA